jgi:CheY-like chemotaxis protein
MTRVVSPDQCTGIKTDPALRSITIIAVTSYVLNGKEQIAWAAGCDDCVPKSFSTLANSWRKSVSIRPRPPVVCCATAYVHFSHKADISRLNPNVRFWG